MLDHDHDYYGDYLINDHNYNSLCPSCGKCHNVQGDDIFTKDFWTRMMKQNAELKKEARTQKARPL